MITKIKSSIFALLFLLIGMGSCTEDKYSFGDITVPSEFTLTTALAGASTTNPTGDGTGVVVITAKASNAITYKIDFGDGTIKMIPSGTINYKYADPGTKSYTITANAVGTAGTTTTSSTKVTVYVAFEIPAAMLSALTNGSSKKWVMANDVPGHFGIGPADGFTPSWWFAGPNTYEAKAYDDEVTFSQDASKNVSITVDNKGDSFVIGAATTYYGFSGADGLYAVNTEGTKKLTFMGATSASTTANSTRVQFTVPGNGIVNFGTGATTYEILSITSTSIQLRNIGADGNAWYQILKAK